ncbi:MAG: DoxX family protein [Gammaproteobacteria bacterium]|nr:DoxX family protein [Gammaproteobacteria bacterium]
MSSLSFFNKKKELNLWPITLLRVYTGAFFAYHGFGKVKGGNFADSLAGFVGSQENSYGFFRPFLDSVVLPNKALFGFLVSWGELAVGLALIVGLMTRYASIAGAVMLASFWFAKGQPAFSGQNHDFIWVMIFIVLAAVHAGRQHGLDEQLGDKFKFLR